MLPQDEQPKLWQSILVPMWLAAPIWPVPENVALSMIEMPFAHVYFSLQKCTACDLRADIPGPSCIDLASPLRLDGRIGTRSWIRNIWGSAAICCNGEPEEDQETVPQMWLFIYGTDLHIIYCCI